MKIEMKSIRIYGSESSYAGDHTFDNWFDAGVHIRGIAMFAPKGGAYDKTNFEIRFKDDSNYNGRLDIQHYTMPYEGSDNDLAKHIYEHCRFHAGKWCPLHMTREDYQNTLKGYGPDNIKDYQEFLDNYDIPKSDGVVVNRKNRDRQQAEQETARLEKEADPLYPVLKEGRSAVTRKMRQLLRKRSGKTWSVKGGRGTGWGWLTIAAPPSRMDNWRMTEEDQAELSILLDEKAHCQGVSVSSDSWWHYLKACRGDFSESQEEVLDD